ncbi:hypothetical protein IJG04_03355 [Candidatus Saccharibacteria bacterium]|nr:hypothetical protein [Candidatus Saccharibacteria bacterium]
MDPSYNSFGGNANAGNSGAVGGMTNPQNVVGRQSLVSNSSAVGAGQSGVVAPVVGQSAQQPVISSGTGDIVLNNNGKKSRKPLVIAIIVVVVMLIMAVIALAVSGVFGGKKTSNGNGGIKIAGTQEYLNYVVNGDMDNSEVGDGYSDAQTYYIQKALFINNDDWDGFYKTASEDLNNFLKQAEEESSQANMISEQLGLVEMFNVYNNLSGYDVNGLMQAYADGSYNNAQSLISEQLDSLNIGVVYVGEYVNRMDAVMDTVGMVVTLYEENGCTGGGGMEALSLCAMTEAGYNDLQTLMSDAYTKYSELNYTMSSAVKYYIREAYGLNGIWNSGVDMDGSVDDGSEESSDAGNNEQGGNDA